MKVPNEFKLKDGKLFYNKQDIGRCYRETDGYYVFWPDNKGFYNAWFLMEIALWLDILNEEIDKRLNEQLR